MRFALRLVAHFWRSFPRSLSEMLSPGSGLYQNVICTTSSKARTHIVPARCLRVPVMLPQNGPAIILQHVERTF
jgi:hypothetical protein